MLFGAVGPAVVKFSIMGGFGTAAALPCSDLSWHDNVSIRLAYRKAGALVGACTLAEPCVSHSGLSCHRVHSAEGVDGTSGVYMFNATEMEAVCGSAQERTGDMQTCSGGLWADACLDSTGMVGGADRGGGLCLAATRFRAAPIARNHLPQLSCPPLSSLI